MDSSYGYGLWVVSPSTSWPAGTYCTGTIAATKVHDVDTVDPLDTMAANVTFSFQIDAAPYVVSSNQSNYGGYFPGAPISVTFSEPVSVSSASLACYGHSYPLAPQPNVSQDGKTRTWTGAISTVLDGQNGEIEGPQNCVFTINALDVEDNEYLDPPSKMANAFTLTLGIEQAPYVTNINISPMVGETSGPNPPFVVTFSEKVNINNSSHAFTLTCDGEPYSLSGGTAINKNSATLTASSIGGPECTFTVVAEYVSDADSIDPPDHPYNNASRTFSTDQAPYIVGTMPENGATMPDSGNPEQPWGVLLGWSEPVVMGEDSYSIVCGPSNTVIPSDIEIIGDFNGAYGIAVYTESDLSAYQGQTCAVTITGANVSDVDAADPPDHSTNYTLTFTIDSPPSVTSVDVLGDSDTSEGTLSESSSTTISTGARFRVNFSEPVDVVSGAFNLYCAPEHSIDFEVVGSFEYMSEEVTSIVIEMDSESIADADGLSCTMDLSDDPDGVVDADIYDSPDDIDRAYSWDFTFDEAPEITGTPTMSSNGTITFLFSEPVIISMYPESYYVCDNGTISYGFALNSADGITWTASPYETHGYPTCVLTIPAVSVSDTDTVDTPDHPANDIVITVTRDDAPSVVLEYSTPSAQYQAIGDSDTIVIVFSENVSVSDAGVAIVCDGTPALWSSFQEESDTVEFSSSSWGLTGDHCTLTIDKDVVSDDDGDDPPDAMAADFVLHFVVGADEAPQLVSWTLIAANQLQMTFSEGVTLGVNPPAPFPTVTCDSAGQAYGISFTDDPKVWILTLQWGIAPGRPATSPWPRRTSPIPTSSMTRTIRSRMSSSASSWMKHQKCSVLPRTRARTASLSPTTSR